MKLSDYDYNLPPSLIAKKPQKSRGGSRLLFLNRHSGGVEDRLYVDLPSLLKPGDLLILNDTKVIKARLRVKKQNGVDREIIVLEKHSFDKNWHVHNILYKKSLKVGDELSIAGNKLKVRAILGNGIAEVFSDVDLLKLTDSYGEVPLPPYMHRKSNANDIKRYQTVWAKDIGSAAAPTASLNMTQEILNNLSKLGIKTRYVTLHVGLGTFLPIRTDNLKDHEMHKEYFKIPKETVEAIYETKKNGGRVIAVGTTVTRALEYSYKQIQTQQSGISGEADIFIYPGYEFKIIDGLLTNYHAPRSTVLMLTAAFANWDKLLPAYKHAIQKKYSFLSYGDSMLIL
ncbi:MAG: tRNA preQ1(34) S-adenosylmethionine ribosyltransferase-isomerase QueA [Candidatus Saccharimonadales bacterium]